MLPYGRARRRDPAPARRLQESLDDSARRLIETAAAGEYMLSLAEFNTNNARALRDLRAEGKVEIRRFDDDLLKTFAEISAEAIAEAGSGDELAGRINRSYMDFQASIGAWSELA